MRWEQDRGQDIGQTRDSTPSGLPVNGKSVADFAPARSTAGEQVLVRYTRGQGRFSPDKRYITLSMTMYTPDGRPDGHHEGVWEAQFRDPSELLWRPDPPTGPMNEPQGPVEQLNPSAETKAVWVFGDGSTITAIGPAMSHLVQLEDGSFLFMVCCAQTITGGTGAYEGAHGLKTSLGSTHVPRGVDLFGPGDVQFEATTVDTFRVLNVRNATDRSAPNPGPPTGSASPPAPSSGPRDQGRLPALGAETVPANEAQAVRDITEIHVNLMRSSDPTRRGPHRKQQGCLLANFHVRDDIPPELRQGLFSEPLTYFTLVRYSNGGGEDDRKPDAHGMSIKVLGVPGPKLLDAERDAGSHDFIVCDNPVFIVRDVREMVEFEQAKRISQGFPGGEEAFARAHPAGAALLRAFGQSGFLKPPKPSPLEAEYWSQTPSSLGAGRAVKYWAVPQAGNISGRRLPDTPDGLRRALHDFLVSRRTAAYFDFNVVVQTDPVRMPVEDPTVLWEAGPANTATVATIEILPLPFESADQMQFCEDLSFTPWHALAEHRPLGGINRARRVVYEAASTLRHRESGERRAEPTVREAKRLWNISN
jgi:hypothetical protein